MNGLNYIIVIVSSCGSTCASNGPGRKRRNILELIEPAQVVQLVLWWLMILDYIFDECF